MSVSDGEKVNAAVTNAAYLSRKTDSGTIAKVDFQNADLASGSSIFNIQKAVNGVASFLGAAPNGTFDQKPTWNNNNYGSPTDTVKDRVDTLDAAVDANADAIAAAVIPYGSEIPFWSKVTITYLDIAIAALTNTVIAFSLPAAGVIHAIIFKHELEFLGGTVTDISANLGIAGDVDRYVSDFDIFSAPGGTVFDSVNLVEMLDFGNITDINLEITAVGDNLDQLTQGSLDVWFLTSNLGF